MTVRTRTLVELAEEIAKRVTNGWPRIVVKDQDKPQRTVAFEDPRGEAEREENRS